MEGPPERRPPALGEVAAVTRRPLPAVAAGEQAWTPMIREKTCGVVALCAMLVTNWLCVDYVIM